MRGLAFTVTFFLGLIALGLFQRALHVRIRTQFFGAMPFLHRQIHFVGAVVGPPCELRDVRRIRRDPPRVFQRLQRRSELALMQIKHRQIQQQR